MCINICAGCFLTLSMPCLPLRHYMVSLWNQKLGFDPYSAWYIGTEWVNGLEQLFFDSSQYTEGRPSITVARCHSDSCIEQTGMLYVHHPTHPQESLPLYIILFRNEYFWCMQNQQISPDVIFMKSLVILTSNSLGLWCPFLFSIAWHGF